MNSLGLMPRRKIRSRALETARPDYYLHPYHVYYRLGNKDIFQFSASEKIYVEVLAEHFFRRFPAVEGFAPSPRCHIQISTRLPSQNLPLSSELPASGDPRSKADECYYIQGRQITSTRSAPPGALPAIWQAGRRRIQIVFDTCPQLKEDFFRTPFHHLLQSILFEHQLILLHSSVVAREGTGIAFLGDSGAGKTTTLLRLLRENFSFLNDDLVVLSINKSFPMIYAHHNELHLLDDALAMFNELSFLSERKPVMKGSELKRVVLAKEFLSPAQILLKHRLHIIVFLERNPGERAWQSLETAEGICLLLKYCKIFNFTNQTFPKSSLEAFLKCMSLVKFYKMNAGNTIDSIPVLTEAIRRHAGSGS